MPTRSAYISLSLCLALLACQSSPLSTPRLQNQSPSSLHQSLAQPLTQTQTKLSDKAAPAGYLTIEPGKQAGVSQLRFQINYPPPAAGFQTQALNYTGFSSFQVSIRGIGLAQALYPAAAAGQNQTIAAVGCNNTAGCQLNTSIANVPSGENRIATVVAYDAAGQVIPGSTLAAVFTIEPNQTAATVQLSYRSTPAGQLADGLLQQTLNLLLAEMDVTALQAKLDLIMGGAGATYTTHPALLNVPAILNDFKLNNGDITALNPANPAYVNAGGTVKGKTIGLLGDDKVSLRLSDPASGAIIGLSNADFQFDKVPVGTWQLIVDAPADYTVTGVPATVVVTANGTLNLGDIQLNRKQPTITSLAQSTIATGETLTINGTRFANQAADNVVVIGGVTVPANQITVVSGTQLKVVVPNTLPLGATTVSVTVGGQTATNQPALTVAPPGPLTVHATMVTKDSFNLTWTAVTGASNYKIYQDDVLIATTNGSTFNLPINGLTPATAYKMEVSAVVTAQESARSLQNVNTRSDWTQGWTALGNNTEDVLAVTVSAQSLDRVYYGSRNGGASLGGIWRCVSNVCSQVETASNAGAVQAIEVDPNNAAVIYAGSTTKGVLKSTDSGDTWLAINNGLTHLDVRSIEIDPKNSAHVYLGTRTGGVYYSSDSGQNWVQVNTNMPVMNIGSLSISHPSNGTDPAYIYAGTLGGGVFRSALGVPPVIDWQSINNGLPTLGGLVFLSQVDVTVLFNSSFSGRQFGAGTGGCTLICQFLVPGTPSGGYLPGIWRRSVDLGGNSDWVQVGHNGLNEYDPEALEPNIDVGLANMNILDMDIDPTVITTFYASTENGIFLSTNEGTRWAAINTGLQANTKVNGAAINPFRLYIATNKGLYRAQ